MAKYKELSKKDKIAFYFGLLLILVYVAFFCIFLWGVGSHLYHQEYYKAAALVGLFLTGRFWTIARKRKKKIAELEHENLMLKLTRKSNENEWFMKGWQGGIDFQRRILLNWAEQRRG